MAVEEPKDLFITANKILQTVNEVFAEHSHALPDRKYVIVGEAAHDCEQVTVSFNLLGSGLPQSISARPSSCQDPTNATYVVEVVRSLPQGKGGRNTSPIVPSAVDITLTAERQMTDARLLAEVAHRVIQGSWFEDGAFSIQAGAASGIVQAVSLEINIAV